MSKIAVVLPTRNRPELLERFIDSVYLNCDDQNNVSIYLYVDDDDTKTKECLPSLGSKYPLKISVMIGKRILLSDTANKLFSIIKEDIVFLGGDDLIIRTKGWDSLVLEKFDQIEDKIALLFGDDLYQKELATHPIIHRRWIETLGYLTPPYFSSDFSDTWLTELSERLGRKYKLNFVNEHMHFTLGKSSIDSTYLENRIRFEKDKPYLQYDALADIRDNDYLKLKSLLNTKYEK
jgi:hypothetical protein